MKKTSGAVVLFLTRLTGKGVVFFFILSVLLAATYLLGNFQEFLDTSQFFLLRVLEVSLLLQVAFCPLHLLLLLLRAAVARRFPPLRFTLAFLSLTVSFALLLGLKFLSAWFQFD